MVNEETVEKIAVPPDNSAQVRRAKPVLWMIIGALFGILAYPFFTNRVTMTEQPAWSDAPLEEVNGADLSHKSVVLDGHRWKDVNFTGAILYYDGTASTELINCQANSATLTSHSKAITVTIALLNGLQKANDSAQPAASPSLLRHGKHRGQTSHR